jgi:hypothetical protein
MPQLRLEIGSLKAGSPLILTRFQPGANLGLIDFPNRFNGLSVRNWRDGENR